MSCMYLGTNMVSLETSEEKEIILNLSHILAFTTGADKIPAAGFETKIKVTFVEDILPQASTCALQLSLPLKPTNYTEFKSFMVEGIIGAQEFGIV